MAYVNFEQVLKGKYPAKSHAQRTAQSMRSNGIDPNGVIYLEAAIDKLQLDNDFPQHFRCVISHCTIKRLLLC